MTTLMQLHLTCPNCRHEFETQAWASTNTFGGQTTDFRSLASGMQFLALEIHTCQVCGYTARAQQFEGEPPSKEVSTLIKERLTPLVRDERAMPWRRYEYAAWIAEWEGRTALDVGDFYLRAAWCCADDSVEGEGDSESYYRRMAIDYFERAIESGGVDPSNVPVVTYLIGEQYRRLGEPEHAAPWYERAIEDGGASGSGPFLIELARQQKTNPQELMSRE